MAVKPRLHAETRKSTNEFLDKQFRRIYLVWVIGIAIGAIDIQLDKVSFGGISFAVNSAEKLQGLVYCVCVLIYIATLGMAIFMAIQITLVERDQLRTAIYRALGKKKTLLGLDARDRSIIRSMSIVHLNMIRTVIIIGVLVPLVHIVFLQQPTFLAGIDLIFHTHSVTVDHKVIPMSGPVFGLTLAFCFFVYSFLYLIVTKFETGYWSQITSTTFLTIIVVSVLDSYGRGIPYNDAMGRTVLCQFFLTALLITPKVVLMPFSLWMDAQLAWYRFRIKRQQKKNAAKQPKQDSTTTLEEG